MTTLFSALHQSHASRDEHVAIITPTQVITAREVLDTTSRVAEHLKKNGIRRSDRVGIALHNGADFVTAFFAVASLGAIAVPLNPALKEPELASILSDAEVSLVLTEEALRTSCESALHLGTGRAAERVQLVADCAAGTQSALHEDSAAPDDAVLFLYSSGSTGKPKRVSRTQSHLMFETVRLIDTLQITAADRLLGVAPFSHVNGLLRSMVASRVSGATLVTMPQFERRAVAHAIEQHRITGFIGVPFMFEMLAQSRWATPVDFTSLRYCISASAPLRMESSIRFHERYGLYVFQLYGTTETGTISLNIEHAEGDSLMSVGVPLPGVDVDIFGEDGRVITDHSPGDIGIRSPAAAAGYEGNAAQTKESFRRGYFFPGDIGYKDARGLIYLSGRKSLFINRGGFKVNPYEVESVLVTHPKISEVVVHGVDSPLGDQRVRAVVVLSEPADEEEIVAFCRERIADYKIPSVIEFRTELPRSATGKVLRSQL